MFISSLTQLKNCIKIDLIKEQIKAQTNSGILL